jgi:hypothetical protein
MNAGAATGAAGDTMDAAALRIRATKEAIDMLHNRVLGPHFEEIREIASLWRGQEVVGAEHQQRRAAVDFDEYVAAATKMMLASGQ